MKLSVKVLQFSPIACAVMGMFCGLIVSEKYLIAFICLGACLGAVIGIISAVICLATMRKNCVSIATLVCNVILFVVIARELQIIG
jgi:hypothetical protein